MINRRKDQRVEIKENCRGGEGICRFTYGAEGDALAPHTRLLTEIAIDPHSSLGWHNHEGETEYYVITAGTGLVNDNGKEEAVTPGDVVVTGRGAFHSIANTGNVPLVFLAVIITE
jgi:mannose-6-phosphate isomerase-like protein (cupin superfamily)